LTPLTLAESLLELLIAGLISFNPNNIEAE